MTDETIQTQSPWWKRNLHVVSLLVGLSPLGLFVLGLATDMISVIPDTMQMGYWVIFISASLLMAVVGPFMCLYASKKTRHWIAYVGLIAGLVSMVLYGVVLFMYVAYLNSIGI